MNVLAKLDTPEVVEPVVRLGAMDGSGERVEVRDVDKSEVSKLELALSLRRMKERFKLLEMTEIEAEEKVGAVIANMEYSNISENLKVFRRKYTVNKLTLKAVKSRVTVARKWMKEIHESFTENSLNLSETELD